MCSVWKKNIPLKKKKSNSAAFMCITLVCPLWTSESLQVLETSSCGCCSIQRQLGKLRYTSSNEGLRNSTGARRDDPSYTASQPTVALKEYVDIHDIESKRMWSVTEIDF